MRDAYGAIELFRQHRLVGAAEVAADDEGQALVEQDLGGLVVMEPRKRGLHGLELRRIALEDLQLFLAALEHARDYRRDEALSERDHVVEVGVGHLRFDHPELGQVAPRLALLGAEGRPERVDPAERHRVGFVVQLPALRQVRFLVVEVFDGKQRRRALAGRGREDRRVGEDEALLVEEIADRVDDLVAHAQDRRLPLGADPQVPPIHQVIDAMFLRRDGIVVGLVHHFEPVRDHLVAADRAGLFLHLSGDDDRAFLSEVIGFLKRRFVDVALAHHHLQKAAAVADDEEMDLAARSAVVQPAFDGDVLPDVRADLVDIRMHQVSSSPIISSPMWRSDSSRSRAFAACSRTGLRSAATASSNIQMPS